MIGWIIFAWAGWSAAVISNIVWYMAVRRKDAEWREALRDVQDVAVNAIGSIRENIKSALAEVRGDDGKEDPAWPCEGCVHDPPSSGDGKPCCACDPDDPRYSCYERREGEDPSLRSG